MKSKNATRFGDFLSRNWDAIYSQVLDEHLTETEPQKKKATKRRRRGSLSQRSKQPENRTSPNHSQASLASFLVSSFLLPFGR
jgi:hypothetical protein